MIFNRRKRELVAGRPVARPGLFPIDWLLEAIALVGLLSFAGFLIYHFPRLPETVPTHFNVSGAPDGYSSKTSFLMLPAMALFIYILLGLIVFVPQQFNYSVKITPANALKQYTFAIRLVRYLKAVIVWIFFYITYATVRVVAKTDQSLGLWFLPVVLAGIFVPLIIYLIVSFKHR